MLGYTTAFYWSLSLQNSESGRNWGRVEGLWCKGLKE